MCQGKKASHRGYICVHYSGMIRTLSAAKAGKRAVGKENSMCKCTERIFCICESAIILFVKYGHLKQVAGDELEKETGFKL